MGVRGVTNEIVVRATRADSEEIRRTIEQALTRQAQREAKRLHISVNDGVVTLSGHVRSWAERNAVDRVATYARGVRKLEDKLVVDPYS